MTRNHCVQTLIAAVALAGCPSTTPEPPPYTTDAAPAATCGNTVCEAGETLASCPADCSRCGDSTCTGTETVQTCPEDCGSCGDGVCASNESLDSCAQDCGANLELQNDTSYIITAFYFEPCGGSWTGNVLAPYTIGDYSSFELTGIPPGCYYWEGTAGTTYWETPTSITLTAGATYTWTMY